MPNNADPKELWQLQASEARAIALYEIHRKAKQEEIKVRRQFIAQAAISAMLIGFSVWQVFTGRITAQRIAFGIIGAWSLAGLLPTIRKFRAVDAAPAAAGVEYFRTMLKKRRDQIHHAWLGLFGPILVAALAFVFPLVYNTGLVRNAIPFFTLLLLWAILYAVKAARELRYIRRELDELEHPIA